METKVIIGICWNFVIRRIWGTGQRKYSNVINVHQYVNNHIIWKTRSHGWMWRFYLNVHAMLFSAKLHFQSWCDATQCWHVISAFSLSARCLLRNEIECSVAPACFIPDAESYIHYTAYVCQRSVIICIAAERSFEKRSATGALQSWKLSQCFMCDTCHCTVCVCTRIKIPMWELLNVSIFCVYASQCVPLKLWETVFMQSKIKK